MGDTGKVRAIEGDGDASRSTAAGSVGRVAAELTGAAMRTLDVATLSPDALDQIAGLVDRIAEAKRRPDADTPQPGLDVGPAVLRILAVILGLIVVMVLVMGVLAGLRVADKLEAAAAQNAQRTGLLEARVREAEAKRLEHQAELDKARKDADALAEDLADDLGIVKARQDAMVLHLVDAVNRLAKAQGVELPQPGTVLRIAKAEAEAKAGG